MIWLFPYHIPYQPSTNIGVSGWYAKKSFFPIAEGGTKILGYFVWKITILRQKIIFSSILGGRAPGAPLPESAPVIFSIYHFKKMEQNATILINEPTPLPGLPKIPLIVLLGKGTYRHSHWWNRDCLTFLNTWVHPDWVPEADLEGGVRGVPPLKMPFFYFRILIAP